MQNLLFEHCVIKVYLSCGFCLFMFRWTRYHPDLGQMLKKTRHDFFFYLLLLFSIVFYRIFIGRKNGGSTVGVHGPGVHVLYFPSSSCAVKINQSSKQALFKEGHT